MAFKTIDRQAVAVRISDAQFGPFAVARQACLVDQHYGLSYDNQTSLVLEVDVRAYQVLAGGELGALISQVPLRREKLHAANDTLVDAATGQVLAVCPPFPDPAGLPEAWAATIEELSQDRDTLLQGDFFAEVAEKMPVRFNDLIRQYMLQADAAGKFA